MPSPSEIANGLSRAERAYLLATPLQQPYGAGVIAYYAGAQSGGSAFAWFAKRYGALFHRLPGQNGTWTYRLSALGQQVRGILKGDSNA